MKTRGASGRRMSRRERAARLVAALSVVVGLQLACARADVLAPPAGWTSGDTVSAGSPVSTRSSDDGTPGEDLSDSASQGAVQSTVSSGPVEAGSATPTTLAWPTAEEIVPGLLVVFFPDGPSGWNPSPTATWSFVDLPDYVFPTITWPTATPRPATATPPPTPSPSATATVEMTILATESPTSDGSTATSTLSPAATDVPPTPTWPPPSATAVPLSASMTGRIAFSADDDQDGKGEIYVVESPWEQATHVASADLDQILCDWFSRGDEILFESHEVSDRGPRLYRIGGDGADLLPLIPPEMAGAQADWSPDGSKVAFVGWVGSQTDVFVVDSDGSGLLRLTETDADEASPDWSPDGRRLVYVSTRDGNEHVFRMNPDGSGDERLTSSTAAESEPVWSPQGGGVALVRSDEGESQIWLVAEDGSAENPILAAARRVGSLAWSPDGRLLAFVADWGEGSDVFVLHIASGEMLRLTSSAAEEQGLTWVP